MNLFFVLLCICAEIECGRCPISDSLKMVKEATSKYYSMALPFEDNESIHMNNIQMSENREMTTHKYVIENNSDNHAFVWFGHEDFFIYMNRPLFPLSIMAMVYEYGSTLSMDSSNVFTIPFVNFYKIVEPHEKFEVYVYDTENNFSEKLVTQSLRYISEKSTFLQDSPYLALLQDLGYQGDQIILNMKLFAKQLVWVKQKGLQVKTFVYDEQ